MATDALLLRTAPLLAMSTTVWVTIAVIAGLLFVGALYWFVKTRQLTEVSIQATVHKLEHGWWRQWVLVGVLLAAIAGNLFLWFFWQSGFIGLSHPRAFEQAVIARELARGNGFSTKIIRPAEFWIFEKNKGAYPVERIPDTYHAPLWPAVVAPFVWLARGTWAMTEKEIAYPSDKIMAAVATAFFLLSVLVSYFTAKRIFDRRLALLAMGLLLLCDLLWQFSMTALPQMLMLFLFSCAAHCYFRAIEAHCYQHPLLARPAEEGEEEALPTAAPPPLPGDAAVPPPLPVEGDAPLAAPAPGDDAPVSPVEKLPRWLRSPLPWLGLSAVFFGLLALTHALTVWIFVGALIFTLLYFRPIGRGAAIMLGIFLVLFTPWMVRNHKVCGSPVGVAWYSGLYQIRGTESSIMRSSDPPLTDVSPGLFRNKVQTQTIEQFARIYGLLGSIVVAPLFFVALLHLFKRRETAVFRWCILVMWLAAVLGMSVFGLDEQTFRANDLHVLFIPLLTFYGLAFALVLWSRLEINIPLIRVGFVTLLFLISAIPFLTTLISNVKAPSRRVQWPPYVPPWIAILGTWTEPKEVIMSDMPWAVAWYADRTSLWLPMTVADYTALNDYNRLQARIVGLYVTPVSRDNRYLSDVLSGDYKEWHPFLTGNVSLNRFPLRVVRPMPMLYGPHAGCILYSDRDRWTARED
jgi:hypothetical protein